MERVVNHHRTLHLGFMCPLPSVFIEKLQRDLYFLELGNDLIIWISKNCNVEIMIILRAF